MNLLTPIILGVFLSGAIAGLAYRRRSLSASGVWGAMLVGTLTFSMGDWVWGMTLISFFVLSSALSHYRRREKEQAAEKFAKGSRRDFGQALANGGLGALIAAATRLYPTPALLAAFVGALATVNADTWSTELGVLSRRPPRLITTGKPVETGTSGGVTLLGTGAALLGGLAIGGAALGFSALNSAFGQATFPLTGNLPLANLLWLLPVATLGGLTGALFDSLLGATLQGIYYSEKRHKETEKAIDPDGTPNRRLRGWAWLDNDWVNFLSSCVGALIGTGIWALWQSL